MGKGKRVLQDEQGVVVTGIAVPQEEQAFLASALGSCIV